MELDSQKMEDGLRQMNVLLEKFATSPLPNYQGFLSAIVGGNYLALPKFYFAAVIAEILNECEQLIAEDQNQGKASEEGLQAFLRYKLLIKLLQELSPGMKELIDGFQHGAYDKRLEAYNQTIVLADKIIALDPKCAEVYLWRGIAYFKRGDYDKAIKDCTQAISLETKIAPAYTLRGTAHFFFSTHRESLNTDWASIIKDFDEAVRLVPNHAGIYLNRGGIYQDVGDNAKAVEDYDNAVRLCPNYETDCIDRQFMYGGKALVERAIELLDSIYPWRPKSAEAYYYNGVKALFQNDGTSALECFKIALELGHDDQEKIKQHLENLQG